MADLSHCVIFFDIGNTLASVRVDPDGKSIELIAFPDVPPVLKELRQRGAQLGIISNRGEIPEQTVNQALKLAGLLQYFNPEFIFYGPKDSSLIFEQAATRVRQLTTAARVLAFVGEDATERAYARAADYLVAPHPQLALSVLSQEGPLRFLRIRIPKGSETSPWQTMLQQLAVVPLHASAPGNDLAAEVYAIAAFSVAARLDDLGFWVDRLGVEDEPLTSDLYILRDDQQMETGFLNSAGNSFDFFRCVSEDFFVGPKPNSPAPDSNPNYHLPADNAVNAVYAADIARAVAAAAWIASTR